MRFKILTPLDSGKFYFNRGLYYKVILVVCMPPILVLTTNVSCSQLSEARLKGFLFLLEYKTQSSYTITTINSTSNHISLSSILYCSVGFWIWCFPRAKAYPSSFRHNVISRIPWAPSAHQLQWFSWHFGI